MSTNTVPGSPRRTRPSNVNKHLGLPDAPQKKRTMAEKRNNDQLVAAARKAKQTVTRQAIEDIGDLEAKMAVEQKAATAPVKPVCLCTKESVDERQGTTGSKLTDQMLVFDKDVTMTDSGNRQQGCQQ